MAKRPVKESKEEASVKLLPIEPVEPSKPKPSRGPDGRLLPGHSGNPNGLVLFSKVKEARKALLTAAEDIRDLYMKSIVQAIADGEYAAAQQGLQWLMEHMPADEDGVKMIDQNIDKPKVDSGKNNGPQINIGVQLGGLSPRQALPAAIEVKDITDGK